ncbi:oxygenase [Lithospermum erythrorhizon]|uniref:Oxygenase n=1 Tax=Lithospermum erythrorhizon TaxID=34254 RepID=A0AAV3RXU5_LITER
MQRFKGEETSQLAYCCRLPGLLVNLHRVHDFVADFLVASGGTYVVKGSWFGNGGMLITCDPANIHHILSKKFPNYGKRPQFKKIFAELGDGIFIAEAQSWEFQRKTTHAILHHKGIDVDLQELIHLTCVLLFDYDPVSLSIEFPKFPCKEAFTVAEEGILYRHILPEIIWKLQKRFQIGKENKLRKAVGIIDEFLGNQIASKHEKLKNNVSFQEGCFDFLTGKETIAVALTWFFWLMAKNPDEEYKIRQEITLSLFPPVPLNHKAPVEADILPSGHRLKPNTKTVLSFYSMGRMEQIWGKDCVEFKPSRWISERGGIKHEASFKFTAFNAGARSCLGKDMSFIQMKMVAAALIYHFEFKVLEGQSILPSPSIILHMQNDLDNNMYVM